MQKILVSRCLLGHRVRYDGGAHGPFDQLQLWLDEGRVVALCPEVAGGLPTPRPPAEIRHGQGGAVLDGRLPVLTIEGEDVRRSYSICRSARDAQARNHDGIMRSHKAAHIIAYAHNHVGAA